MEDVLTTTFGDTQYTYSYLTGETLRDFVFRPMGLGKTLSIDIETYSRDAFKNEVVGDKSIGGGLLPYKSKIRTLQMWNGESCVILDFMESDGSYMLLDPLVAKALQDFLLKHTLVAHSAIFETSHLQNLFQAHGFDMKPLNIRCSMQLYQLCISAQTHEVGSYGTGLSDVFVSLFGYGMPKESQTSDWSILELSKEQLDYCARDAIAPLMIMKELLPYAKEYGLEKVFLLNTEATEAVAMMRLNGITVNADRHKELWDSWEVERDKYSRECIEVMNAGVMQMSVGDIQGALLAKIRKGFLEDMTHLVIKYIDKNIYTRMYKFIELSEEVESQEESEEDNKGRGLALRRLQKNIQLLLVNLSSSKQLSNWIKANCKPEDIAGWPTTSSGKDLKTGSDEFVDFSHIPELASIVKYKRYDKMCSTYGAGMAKFFVEVDGRTVIFPNYTLCQTVTGRTSSNKPNFQNQDKDPEFRKIFIPRSSNHRMLVADYSQIEIRIAAEVSKDPVMLKAYRDGQDIHKLTASAVGRVPLDQVTKEQRQRGKPINFLLLYGGGATTLRLRARQSYGVDMTEDEAVEAVEIFRDTYSVFRDWQLETTRIAEHSMNSTTTLGKFRELNPEKWYTTSLNHNIQGSAGEVMLQAIVNIQNGLWARDVDAFLVGTVHDEVLVECALEDIEEVKEVVKSCMEDAYLSIFPSASIRDLIDVGVGNNWYEAK